MRFFVALFVIALLSGCGDSRFREHLASLDSVLVSRPDSVLDVLYAMEDESRGQSHSDVMYYELLRADAQNKSYVDFTTDSIMLMVVDYYDRHGTPNEQMRAYYLLGCTYRDLHEAPLTLQYYQTAVERADTTSEDCDFYTMASIYGQMASLYHDQLLADEELRAYDMYSWCSAKIGDKYSEIHGIEMKFGGYLLTYDTVAMFNTARTAHDLYLENNMPEAAAGTYVALIRLCTERGEYERADSMMRVFESQSGAFDDNGNIEAGREHYYCSKGFFYHKMGNIPLAKHYYRRGILAGNYLLALKGMRDVFAEQRNTDSAIYYNDKYIEELEIQEAQRQTQTIQQLNSMYDYSRSQRLAVVKGEEAKRNKTIAFSVAFILLIVIFFVYYRYSKREMRLVLDLSQLNHKFLMASSNYTKAQELASSIGEEFSSYRQAMDNEMAALREEISSYKEQYAELRDADREKAIMQSPVVKAIRMKLPPTNDGTAVTDAKWHELLLLVEQCMPRFYAKVTAGNVLSQDELRLAILTRLKFTPGDIVIIMEKSQVRVSNLRHIVNKKLFSDDSARSLNHNIMQM